MTNRKLRSTARVRRLIPVLILVVLVCTPAKAAAPNESQTSAKADETNATELLRSNLQLQEQLRALQLSVEENRRQADTAAARNAESVAGRLQTLEQTLAAERARDLEAVRSSNRVMLIVSGTFAAVGLLAMLLMGYQWRTVSRLAEATTSFPSRPMLGRGNSTDAFDGSATPLLSEGHAEATNSRLLGALDRLEKRILELEHSVPPALGSATPADRLIPAPVESAPAQPVSAGPTPIPASPSASRIGLLLGKGQSLLNLDKAEEALVCFEEALSIEPAHAEALLKKAMTLEQLRKLPEAVECYDRAIAADNTLTIAYLHKGGLFNRMERYGEALECYEQALRSQDRR